LERFPNTARGTSEWSAPTQLVIKLALLAKLDSGIESHQFPPKRKKNPGWSPTYLVTFPMTLNPREELPRTVSAPLMVTETDGRTVAQMPRGAPLLSLVIRQEHP
jgi:hypothetical protein